MKVKPFDYGTNWITGFKIFVAGIGGGLIGYLITYLLRMVISTENISAMGAVAIVVLLFVSIPATGYFARLLTKMGWKWKK